MATLEKVLRVQKRLSILQAPTEKRGVVQPERHVTDSKPTLRIALQNNTSSSNVWAYITGLDINKDFAVFILRSDGVTPFYPQSPSKTLAPLAENCHIKLGPPGTTRTAIIPQLAGGRIWFCVDDQLTFLVNPGPALVEPSVMNPTDPNYNLFWSFAEFTFNEFQLFANITYVDFVSIPISLALTSNNPCTPAQRVLGIPPSGLDTVCSALLAQHNRDCAEWDKLIIRTPSGTRNLRAVSPNSGIKLFQSQPLFSSYFAPYVSRVWAKYTTTPLTLNTQNQWGVVTGTVSPSTNKLTFPGAGAFPVPSTADIFSCDSGAFSRYPVNPEVMGNITARLAAALNRSTLLSNSNQPDGETIPSYYYGEDITNHYSRIVHEVNLDRRGYAFPYDDVAPREEENVAGTVSDGDPAVFVVAVGGPAVLPQDVAGQRERDLEKGAAGLVVPKVVRGPGDMVPEKTVESAQRRLEELIERTEAGGVVVRRGVRPALQVVAWVVALLSLLGRSLASRVATVVVLFVVTMVLLFFGHPGGVL